MRFAFATAQSNCTWQELAAMWDVADQLDVFTTGWTYDHFYPLRTGPEEPTLEGWTCLAMLLARTRRLRGGVLVSGVPYRHPAVLAKMAVTIDIASEGRLELGVGAGWFEAECEAYGIELGTIPERFDRFEEALSMLHSLLTRPTTSFEGRYYTLRDAWCEPKAVQRPHPPLVLGGKGERRFLPLVAQYADHWNYSGDDVAELVRLRGRLGELCAAHGRTLADITVSAIVRPSPEAPAHAAQRAAELRDAGADVAVMAMPRPYDPNLLEQLAPVLAPLCGGDADAHRASASGVAR